MGWLSGWSNRVKITIDSGDISAALADFPILIYLSASSGIDSEDITFVFDEVGANSKKIAVTKDDGTTECYVEIDTWDAGNEKGWLWSKIPTISHTIDTDIYLYFDNSHADNDTYVGDTNSTTAENVWDANFLMVQHMKDATTSTILDSTSNDNDATKYAANEPIEETGKIGNSQLFDGVNDYGKITNVVVASPSELTISGWIKKGTGGTTYETALHQGTIYSIGSSSYWLGVDLNNDICATIGANVIGIGWNKGLTTTEAIVGQWYFVAAVWDGSVVKVYLDGVYADTQYDLVSYNNGITPTRFGSSIDATGNYKFGGSIDEVRISDVKRSDAWVKASYETGDDDLLTYGNEEKFSGVSAWLTMPTN